MCAWIEIGVGYVRYRVQKKLGVDGYWVRFAAVRRLAKILVVLCLLVGNKVDTHASKLTELAHPIPDNSSERPRD